MRSPWHRQVGDKCSVEDSYYLSSLALSAGAQVVADAVRSHWAVEKYVFSPPVLTAGCPARSVDSDVA